MTRKTVVVLVSMAMLGACGDEGYTMHEFCAEFAEAHCTKGSQCGLWQFTLIEAIDEDCRATFVDGCCRDDGDCDKTVVDQLNLEPDRESEIVDFVSGCTQGLLYTTSCDEFESLFEGESELGDIDGCSL